MIGLQHIADWQGYDHMLFLLALCCVYTISQWKPLLLLITAFTIGHSLTLALCVLDVLTIHGPLIEFLIPLTILATSFHTIRSYGHHSAGNFKATYAMVLFFGLIHGLGFSTMLKSLLGKNENILSALFAFNIGLEAGQLLIVAVVLLFLLALTSVFGIRKNDLSLYTSSAVFGIAFLLAIQRFFELINP